MYIYICICVYRYIQYMVKCGWLENPLYMEACSWKNLRKKSGGFSFAPFDYQMATQNKPPLACSCSTTRMCVTATGKHKTCTSLTYLPRSSGVSPYFGQKNRVAQRSYKLGHVSCPTTQFQGQIWHLRKMIHQVDFGFP